MFPAARIRRILLILCAIGSAAILISLEMGYNMTSLKNYTDSWQNLPFIHTSHKRGYLSTNYECGMHSRLGNQLFELLATIGIADQLNRIPYIKVENEFMLRKVGDSIREQFPMLQRQFNIVYWDVAEKVVSFHNGKCCVYDDVDRLRNETDDYLQLNGTYFQSYKYFDHRRNDVRDWLLPNKTVQEQARQNLPNKYRDHLLICVHIRREDFVISDMKDPSEANFSVTAMKYLMDKYSRGDKPVAAVILGNEVDWEKETFGVVPNVHVMENSTAAEDLAFSRLYCDVVLLTAPSSTYGFFLGYLSKQSDVYYRDILTTKDLTQKELEQDDFFPPTWTRIREKNGRIEEVIN